MVSGRDCAAKALTRAACEEIFLGGKIINAVLLPDELEAAVSSAPADPIPYGEFGSVEELRQAMIADPMIVGFKEVGPAADEHLVEVKLANGEDRLIVWRWE